MSRRDAAQVIALLGASAVGTSALLNSTGTASGATATNGSFVLTDFIPNIADPSTHSAGFQAAVDAAIAAGSAELVVPPGDWHVEGISVPPQTPLKIRGHVADNFPNNNAEVNGRSGGSRLQRTGNSPIFSLVGATSPLPPESGDAIEYLNQFAYCRNLVLEDISLRNANPNATEPLVMCRGAAALHFSRVVFFGGSAPGASLIDMQGTQDTRFDDCFFLGGGDASTGKPAIYLRSGDPAGTQSGYNGCNSIVFVNCSSDNYFGPGIKLGDETVDSPYWANLIGFINHKMDSPQCTTNHFTVGRATGVFMRNGWIAHSQNTDPVIDLRRCSGFYGDCAFILAAIAPRAQPTAMIETSADVTNVQFDVRVMPSTLTSESNIITQAAESPSVDFNINGISQRVNGKSPTRWINGGTVFQTADAENGSCQYVFSKSGLQQWSIGNPSSPEADKQQMEIRISDLEGSSSTAMIISSTGSNTETARKEVRIPNGGIVAEYAELSGNPVGTRVGVPTTSMDAGRPGMWAADKEWLYVVTEPNTWRRVPLNEW